MTHLAVKRVCRECFSDDPYLVSLIEQDKDSGQACDYCSSQYPTLSLETLAEKTDWLIDHYYQLSEWDEWAEEMDGMSLVDVLEAEISPGQQLIDDLSEMLNDVWFDDSSHERKYGDEPYFEEAITTSGMVSSQWSQMETKLRESVRFFNNEALELFRRVFGYLQKEHPSAFVCFEEGYKLYRGRIFQSKEALENALSRPEDSFGPPPSALTPAGRMNARGISVFYGATSPVNAISEVRPPVGSYVVVAEFRLLRTIRLLDLSSLEKLSEPDSSRFDPVCLEIHELVSFIKQLSRKMVMPVVPELEDSNYLLTQAIADYLSTQHTDELDGILFPSAQKRNKEQDDVKNIILFHKSAKVKNAGKRKKNARVELYEYDGNYAYFEPEIVTSEDDLHRQFTVLSKIAPSNDVLELNLENIVVHKITGIKYDTSSTNVRHRKKLPDAMNMTHQPH